MYVEKLGQIHAGSVVVISVFVSPHEDSLVDSMGHIFLVFFIPSGFYNPSSPLLPPLQDSMSSI